MEMTEDTIPEVQTNHTAPIYGPLSERILKLAKGTSLKMVCKSVKEAKNIVRGLQEVRRHRNLEFKILKRLDTVWAWRE